MLHHLRTAGLVGLGIAILATVSAPAYAAKITGGSGSTTCGRKTTCTDTTAPQVSISSPTSGATVSGTVTVAGSAADNTSVTAVATSIDGGPWITATGTTSWASSLDTRQLTNGTHTIAARATDASGNVSTTTSSFRVSNTTADTSAPTISISSPSAGATVSGTVTVTGSAADNGAVSRVEVQVDGGAWQPASGASSWTATVATGSYADGTHTITARATDTAGNAATTNVGVLVRNTSSASNGEIGASDLVLNDPAARYDLVPVGRGRMTGAASLTALLYAEDFTNRRVAFFRNSATGVSSYVTLPLDTAGSWTNAVYTIARDGDLFVVTGSGPLTLRQYRLTGTPVPTSATLVSSRTLGDSDSRQGDILSLASGAIALVWNQQGSTGPEGLRVSYRSPAGAWTELPSLQFMPTYASKQVLAQHPTDGSVWLFNSPDGWGKVGGARLVENAGGLTVDWTDAFLLDPQVEGRFGPDPENPDLAAVPDPTTGAIAVAYQSAERRILRTSPFVAGSHVAVARFKADGTKSFTSLPLYVERITALALSVSGDSTWLGYRPIDQSTMTFKQLHVARYRAGAWSAPLDLGATYDPYGRVGYSMDRPEFSVRLADGRLHLFTMS